MIRDISVLGGHGFIGNRFWQRHCVEPNAHLDTVYDVCLNAKFNYDPQMSNVLYLISTVHNYNVFNDVHKDINTNLNILMSSLENWRLRKKNGVFNFVSSWFVYGGDKERSDVKEDEYCDPKGFYSITKRTAEQLLISYCETFQLKYRIFRLGNVIGGQDPKASKKKNALQYLVNEMKAGRDIDLYGDGQFYRDYIHVNDVADAMALVMEKGPVNEIFNIGNGQGWKFRDILYYCRRMLDSNVRINEIEPKDFHKWVQVKSFYMNTDKIKALGYSAKYLNEILYETLI